MGPPSPEVTGAFCRVPSTSFSQAPWYTLPVHLCRFRVRSHMWGCFLERLRGPDNPISPDNLRYSSLTHRPGNINPVPIGYGFRPRLRGRLTLRGLALRRNPWTFGESVSHTLRYSSLLMSAFSLPHTSRTPHGPTAAACRNPRQCSRVWTWRPGGLDPGNLRLRRSYGTLRYHIRVAKTASAASVGGLSPGTSSAQDGLTRPVSYYAFFKGWLLLSQPPGCLGLPTSFPT